MKLNKRLWVGVAVAAVSIPLFASAAFADTETCKAPSIPLRDAGGLVITDSVTPYSPKATCMATGCHTQEEYASTALKDVTKTQGVLGSDGEIYWQSYNVHASAHGAVVGRHSQQGRNEDYSIAMKTTFKDAYFTSSPGMFGKY